MAELDDDIDDDEFDDFFDDVEDLHQRTFLQMITDDAAQATERLNRQKHTISAAAAVAIKKRDYKGLRKALLKTDPNGIFIHEDTPFEDTAFSGLELAVWHLDWKMMLVFYFSGADPATHWFSGRAGWRACPAVYQAKKTPTALNSGFNRLRMLLNDISVDTYGDDPQRPKRYTEELPKILASLWLLERLQCDTILMNASTISVARSHVRLLNPDFAWEAAFSVPAMQITATLRALGVEKRWDHAIVDLIAEPLIQDLLMRAIRNSLNELLPSLAPRSFAQRLLALIGWMFLVVLQGCLLSVLFVAYCFTWFVISLYHDHWWILCHCFTCLVIVLYLDYWWFSPHTSPGGGLLGRAIRNRSFAQRLLALIGRMFPFVLDVICGCLVCVLALALCLVTAICYEIAKRCL